MRQIYQCWWRIRREINVYSRFEYYMFYVFYPFVTYLLTLPHISTSPCVTKTSPVLRESSHITQKRKLFVTFLRLSLLRNMKCYLASVLLEQLCVFFTSRKLLEIGYKDSFTLTISKISSATFSRIFCLHWYPGIHLLFWLFLTHAHNGNASTGPIDTEQPLEVCWELGTYEMSSLNDSVWVARFRHDWAINVLLRPCHSSSG
jgi:hypothetical protein